ncbi:hypothetical protein ACBJ59_26875 [Nonomuraea sp. MTCD27]|uniref:hypothetical protein n=1 Tax=Nonomuraea sp. MTCD27 TaxID=1676747 RepID=UPI0035C24F6A
MKHRERGDGSGLRNAFDVGCGRVKGTAEGRSRNVRGEVRACAGTVGEWIRVVVPHRSGRGGYFGRPEQRQRLQRGIRADDPASPPCAFHPEPGGLLVWGESRGSEYNF